MTYNFELHLIFVGRGKNAAILARVAVVCPSLRSSGLTGTAASEDQSEAATVLRPRWHGDSYGLPQLCRLATYLWDAAGSCSWRLRIPTQTQGQFVEVISKLLPLFLCSDSSQIYLAILLSVWFVMRQQNWVTRVSVLQIQRLTSLIIEAVTSGRGRKTKQTDVWCRPMIFFVCLIYTE